MAIVQLSASLVTNFSGRNLALSAIFAVTQSVPGQQLIDLDCLLCGLGFPSFQFSEEMKTTLEIICCLERDVLD